MLFSDCSTEFIKHVLPKFLRPITFLSKKTKRKCFPLKICVLNRKPQKCIVLTFRMSFFFVGDSLQFSFGPEFEFEFELVRFRGRKRRPTVGDETPGVDSSYHPESLDDVLAEPFDDLVDDDSSREFDASDDESSSLNSSRKLSSKCLPFVTKSSHL